MKLILLLLVLFIPAMAQNRHIFVVESIRFETINGGTNVMSVGGTHVIIPSAGTITNRPFGFRVPLTVVAPLIGSSVGGASGFWKTIIARAESATNISVDGVARGVIFGPWPVTMEAATQ